MPLPPNLRATLAHIDATQRKYYELGQQRKQIRTMFLLFLNGKYKGPIQEGAGQLHQTFFVIFLINCKQ